MAAADPILFIVSLSLLGVLLIGLLFHYMKQPNLVGYILAGVILGPFGLQIINSTDIAQTIGNFGIALLLFFIGMEISVRELIKKWRIAVFGTLGQIFFSIAIMYILGMFLDWSLARIILLGFVISLSSTAVLLRLLESRGELHETRGRTVLSVLLAQDLAIVPMIIIVSTMGGGHVSNPLLQIIGAIFFGFLLFMIFKQKDLLVLPFSKALEKDHDLQMFTALILCFGFAALSAFFGLSEALGAFVAGILVNNIKGTSWVHDSLHSFKILFVAIFFVSIGMLINLDFLFENLFAVLIIVFIILFLNTIINAITFRVIGTSWKESFYYGSMLAQIGEFSFLLAGIGLAVGVIQNYSYQMTISVIAVSLLFSPLWIYAFQKFAKQVRKLPKKLRA